MARDPQKIYARVQFQAAGENSGHVSNSFVFLFQGASSPTVTDWDALVAAVNGFYTYAVGGTTQVCQGLGPQIWTGTGTSETSLYQIDVLDPHHYLGSPVHAVPWDLGVTGGGDALPNECAATLSFRAAYGSDPEHAGSTRPRAQDRGRIYLGPLSLEGSCQYVTVSGSIKYQALKPTYVSTVMLSASHMRTVALAANWIWCVWSRKDQVLKPVSMLAMDTMIDTQRRRGLSDPLQTWTPA